MTWNVVIACIDTRNPPETLNELAGWTSECIML